MMKAVMLIVHLLGLVMGLGTSFAHAFLGIASAKMSPEEAVKFRLHTMALSKMGNLGIILLVVSGLYLATPYWGMLTSMPLFLAKLGLVVLLIVLITALNLLTKAARKSDSEKQLKKMESIGKLTLLVGVTIVVLAVYTFY
jgi:uncharacterized membrane protein